MMTPERWQQIKDVLGQALELEPEQRSTYLGKACEGDSSLRKEVEHLLAAEQHAGKAFLADTAAHDSASPSAAGLGGRIGQRLGPYRIVEILGIGGMGMVYRAVRADDQYQKQVAIKLVQAGQGSAFVISRFKNERQILATLEHPNIAHLLDGGTTEDGSPYFVMELIEGQPIDKYCDQHGLTTNDRLRLFLQVCAAVQFAHQRLIIHRDIKPGNILVGAEGTPKLLDFGIAKLLDPLGGEDATMTLFRALTPGYASPEQIRGEAITTASDIYSLGVVLYELLTGQSPYRLCSPMPHLFAQAVCEIDPERPSMAVARSIAAGGTEPGDTSASAGGVRDGSPEKLRRSLRGDLDNIVLMALRKEPEHRYSSVEHFSEDIRRYLARRPVAASKGTVSYRAAKFVTRHKVSVLATAVVVITLIAGVVATVREARIARMEQALAEARFNDVRKLANSFMFDFDSAIENVPGTTHAREMLVKTALQYLDSLSHESHGDASLQDELATAYAKVGDIQGTLMSQNVGNTSGGLASYRKAVEIRKSLVEADPANGAARRMLAIAEGGVALLLGQQNDFAGALEYDYDALSIYKNLATEKPTDFMARRDLAAGYMQVAFELSLKGDFKEALTNHQQALLILEKLAAEKPDDQEVSLRLAHAYRLAAYSMRNLGDEDGAAEIIRKSLTVSERVARAAPNNVRAKLDLVAGYEELAADIESRDMRTALQNWQKALEIVEAAAKADPNDTRAKIFLGDSYAAVNLLQIQLGKSNDEKGLLKSLDIKKQLLSANPDNGGRKEVVAESYEKLGEAEVSFASRTQLAPGLRLQHWQNALSNYKLSLTMFQELAAKGALRGEHAQEPDKLRQNIARCEASITSLPRPHGAIQ